jgi:hypothetical protein
MFIIKKMIKITIVIDKKKIFNRLKFERIFFQLYN